MKRVAAVDCGTNSLRLLVADLDPDTGQAVQVERRTTIVRLGQGVDRTGAFAEEALQRTWAALEAYAGLLAGSRVQEVRFVATSAARDVSNRDAFLAGVRERLGVEPEVIDGDEEARLSYDGATRPLAGLPEVARPVLVLDIGGGSTELVTRRCDDAPVSGRSLDIGAVRLTERHLHTDPPTADEVSQAADDIERALDSLDLPLAATGTLVGVAGTITTVAAMVLGLPAYDRDAVDAASLSREDVVSAVDALVRMSVAERRALPVMHPGRADVIAAGGLILRAVLLRVGLPRLRVSSHDILDGIAWSLA